MLPSSGKESTYLVNPFGGAQWLRISLSKGPIGLEAFHT
jgi:hypothetical protein